MDRSVTKAVITAGLVDSDALSQLKRWGVLDDVGQPQDFESPEEVVECLREAIESHEAVETRDTDLDIARQYLAHREKAKLHVPSPEDPEKTIPIPIDFCITRSGEYVLPWRGENIEDLLMNPDTFLKPAGRPRVYFSDVRELFYDRKKVFVVCTVTEK
jgi:hypothetical protein